LSYLYILFWLFVLTAVNAFFVAAEMAYARVRRTHIEQLADEGNAMAKRGLYYLEDPETFFAGSQLGITIAMLVIGAIGESAFAHDLAVWMEQVGTNMGWHHDVIFTARATCYVIVFFITAFVQTIFGELLPKVLTFQRAEVILLWTIAPMHIWCTVTKPFLVIMNATQKAIVRATKIPEPPKHHRVCSEEELKMLVSESQQSGVLEVQEEEMLQSVFEFGDTVASEIMTPRRDMKCIAADKPVKELVDLALKHGHSRIPVYEKDVDNIFGFVHIRDGLRAFVEGKENALVRELARRILIVPENKPLQDLLTEFKRRKTHVAVVIDEHGGTEGMVTFEDLLEELVGDIADEHDVEDEMIAPMEDGSMMIDARIDLEDFNDKLGVEIDDEQFTTLGGHVFGCLGHEPQVGDEVNTDDYTLRIEEADRHRITKLRFIPRLCKLDENETNGTEANPTLKGDSVSQLEAS
jgi:CBS domain containing-hemolysin-like protein